MSNDEDRPWMRMIRDLHRGFDTLEKEVRLLREIDQTILSFDGSIKQNRLEELFSRCLSEFSRIHRVPGPALCYVNTGHELQSLCARDNSGNLLPPTINLSQELLRQIGWEALPDNVGSVVLSRDGNEPLFQQFPEQKTVLICPMYMAPLSNNVLCTFFFFDQHEEIVSHLGDSDFRRSTEALVRQLAIAFVHCEQARRQQWLQTMWGSFLERNLSPTLCFAHLVTEVPSLLPNFGPLKLSGEAPQCQMLTLTRDKKLGTPELLVIRGTTGTEPSGTKIALERSICGLVVTDPEYRDYFLDDPTKPKYSDRYRSYLLRGKKIRTEFAVPLLRGGELVGVLNLESTLPNAFSTHHVDTIISIAGKIAPLASVFEERLSINARMQQSVASSTQQYLDALARIFNHGISTPLRSVDSNLNLTDKIIKSLPELDAIARRSPNRDKAQTAQITTKKIEEALTEISSAHERLREDYSQIRKYTDDFADDIKGYGDAGLMPLEKILRSAIDLATGSLLTKVRNITVKFEDEGKRPDTVAYCSNLLKQHLFSIFNNAVASIKAQLATDGAPGEILVSISEEKPDKTQEVSLNQFWVIKVRDNGVGVTPEQLNSLRRFEPGVRFRQDIGHGHGLTAMQRYIVSIGGRVMLNSKLGEYFEISLYLAKVPPSQAQQ